MIPVKGNILIPQEQESLCTEEGKVEPELETAKADPTDEDSGYFLIETKEEAIEPSTENCTLRAGNTHIWQL